MQPKPKFYTPEDIADMLQMDIQTIRKFLREGEIQGYKFKRVWRISHQQFMDFVESYNPKNKRIG